MGDYHMCNNSNRWEGLFNTERGTERSNNSNNSNNRGGNRCCWHRCCNHCWDHCCNHCWDPCCCHAFEDEGEETGCNEATFASEFPVYVSVPLFLRGRDSDDNSGCGCGCRCR